MLHGSAPLSAGLMKKERGTEEVGKQKQKTERHRQGRCEPERGKEERGEEEERASYEATKEGEGAEAVSMSP